MDLTANLLTSDADLEALLRETSTIAVLGIKPETRHSQPAYFVPQYLQSRGYRIVPVPVYYPEVNEILGEKVYRDLRDVPEQIDMVNVFRRPNDITRHIDEILEAKPRSVWIQSGLRNDEAAKRFAEAGIKVVQDRCLMIEHRALIR